MTKKYFYYFIFLLAWFLVQTAAVKVFSAQIYLIPQAVMLAVVIFAIDRELPEALWFAFAAGFLAELYSGSFFGAQIIAYTFTALGVHFATRSVMSRDIVPPTVFFLVFGATALFPFWVFLFDLAVSGLGFAESPAFVDFYRWGIIWTALLNFLFFYAVMYSARPLQK